MIFFYYFNSTFGFNTVDSFPSPTITQDMVLIPSATLQQHTFSFTAESLTAVQQTLPGVLNGFASWQPEHSVWAQNLVFQEHCSSAPADCPLSLLSSPLRIDCFDLPAPGPSAQTSWWLSDCRSISMNNETKRFCVLTLSQDCNYFCFSPEEPVE